MSKDRFDYFPFYPDAFVCDGNVEAMTTAGVGAYILLLCKAWRENPVGSLPNDDVRLARWARTEVALWLELKSTVMAAFTFGTDGRWHQKRLRQEYDSVAKLVKARSKAGSDGAKARWQPDSKRIAKPSDTRLDLSLNLDLPPSRSDEELLAAQQIQIIYEAYPKKIAKPAALKSIGKALKKIEYAALLEKVQAYARSREGQDPQFTPHPATWFNQERWADVAAANATEPPIKKLSELDPALREYFLDDSKP